MWKNLTRKHCPTAQIAKVIVRFKILFCVLAKFNQISHRKIDKQRISCELRRKLLAVFKYSIQNQLAKEKSLQQNKHTNKERNEKLMFHNRFLMLIFRCATALADPLREKPFDKHF